MAAIGNISRFDSSRKLVAYWDSTRRSASRGRSPRATGGSPSVATPRRARPGARFRSPGPLHAFGERVRVRKGSQVAAVAVARKIACLCWQLLSKEEDYAYVRPFLMRAKIRRAELDAGAPPRSKRHGGQAVSASAKERAAE